MEGGSQWPPQSMWYPAATVLSAWVPVEDWEAVNGSPVILKRHYRRRALTCWPKQPIHTAANTVRWVLLTALKMNMENALPDAS